MVIIHTNPASTPSRAWTRATDFQTEPFAPDIIPRRTDCQAIEFAYVGACSDIISNADVGQLFDRSHQLYVTRHRNGGRSRFQPEPKAATLL